MKVNELLSMQKILGVLFFLGSLLWCLLLIPISLLAPLAKLYETLFQESNSLGFTTYLWAGLGVGFSCLFTYCVIKFGVSILKSSINMIKGKKELNSQERFEALIEKKLKQAKKH